MSFQAFFSVLSLLGSIYAIVIVGLLASGLSKAKLAEWLLFVIFIQVTIVMFLITIVNTGWIQSILWLDIVEKTLTLTSGPIILTYVITRIHHKATLPRTFIFHFLPAVIYILLAINGLSWRFLYNMLHLQIYVAASVFIYFQYRSKYKSKRNSNADWIPLLLSALIVICVAQWLRWFWQELPSMRLIVPFVSSLSFQFLLFTGFRHSNLIKNNISNPVKTIPFNIANQQLTLLQDLMETQLLYQKIDLSLGEVAAKLNTHPNQLSQLLNQHLKISFSDYLNNYRVEKAKALLANPDKSNLTIAALAQEAGFKSRSAFYEAFKKRTGRTPTAYQSCLESPIQDKQDFQKGTPPTQ